MDHVEKVKNRERTLTIFTTTRARPISLRNRSINHQIVQITHLETEKLPRLSRMNLRDRVSCTKINGVE